MYNAGRITRRFSRIVDISVFFYTGRFAFTFGKERRALWKRTTITGISFCIPTRAILSAMLRFIVFRYFAISLADDCGVYAEVAYRPCRFRPVSASSLF